MLVLYMQMTVKDMHYEPLRKEVIIIHEFTAGEAHKHVGYNV